MRKLLDACEHSQNPERDRAIILALLDSGARAAELCGVDVGDVDMTTGGVHIRSICRLATSSAWSRSISLLSNLAKPSIRRKSYGILPAKGTSYSRVGKPAASRPNTSQLYSFLICPSFTITGVIRSKMPL